MKKTSTIFHYVAVSGTVANEQNRSFFQGFSIALMRSHRTIMDALIAFPNDIFELFADDKNYLLSKMCGSSTVCNFLRTDLIDSDIIDLYNGLSIVWSDQVTSAGVAKIVAGCKSRPIHISSGNHGDIKLSDVTRDLVKKIILDWIVENESLENADLFRERIKSRSPKNLSFEVRGHYAFNPNINILHEYGYEIGEIEGFVGISIEDYIKEIIKASREIDVVRDSLGVMPSMVKNDGIIYCNAIYTFLYDWNSHFWNDIRRQLPKNARGLIKASIVKNKGYSNFTMPGVSFDEIGELSSAGGVLGMLLTLRSMENRFFSQIVSILAVSEFCPAIRLPNGVMHFHAQLTDIVSLTTSNAKNVKESLSTKLRNYSDSLKKIITDDLMDLSFAARRKIIAICDFPIEWISIDDVPIMFTREITRISPTPGDLFLQTALSYPKVILQSENFQKVLVIRSFAPDDRVGDSLVLALSHYREHVYKNLAVEIVNVASQEEIVEALEKFVGAIVVFDCHGGHDGEMGIGWLKIGEEKIDTWDLANSCRIPPIVILSACSTHAPDGSHASVANGFFRCGTQSVIGTHAPINSNHAAIFVCRLLHRVSEYLPVVAKYRPVSWRKIVSDFFRLSYVSDILYDLCFRLNLITETELKDVQFECHKIIESNIERWELLFFREISERTNIKSEQWNALLRKYYQYVDTMLYTQLGRPENIMIYDSSSDEEA